MDLALNPGDKIKEKIDHLDISNLTLPRNLYLPRLNSDGFDLNEMDCIETLMSKVNKFSESNFHAYSISSKDLPKNLPIEIISKCNKKIIGIIETCNLESIDLNYIHPSDQWMNCSIESRNKILLSVADRLEDEPVSYTHLRAPRDS